MPAAYDLAPAVEEGFRTCGSTYNCLEVAAASLVAFVAWAGLSTFVLFSPQVNVRAAVAALSEEYRRVEDEQNALASFADRVGSVAASMPVAAQANTVGTAVARSQSGGGGMSEVRCAYEETVMSVDHYEDDYGEPLAEHLASEFGENVAGAVVTSDSVSPPLKQALIAGCREGRAQRDQYLEGLSREEHHLQEAGSQFEQSSQVCAELDGDRLRRRPFDDLYERIERLDDERETVRSTLEARQHHLHEGVRFGWERQNAESVYRYLYGDLDVTYPVLVDGTRLLTEMREVEHRLLTGLTAKT